MPARAPSLEIFEHLVARRRGDEAFREANEILAAIDGRLGRLDTIAWKPATVCVTDEERLSEFATRFSAALGALVVDRGFEPALAGYLTFTRRRRWVDTMFRLSAFGSSAHLLATIGRGAHGEDWCFEGSAVARFLMVWSPDCGFAIDPAEWLAGQMRFSTPAWLAAIGARACLTSASAAFRERLLDLMTEAPDAWRLEPAMLE